MNNFVPLLVVTAISFFCFFFNVPYWTGKEMSEVAHNGAYRLAYVGASTLGWVVYQVIERICNGVSDTLRITRGSFIHTCINTAFYILVVWVACNGYDSIMSEFMRGEIGQLHIAEGDSFARYSDLLLFWGFINNFGEVSSISEFFTAVADSFWNIVAFVILTMIFFSIMYGLLMHKLQEVKLVERYSTSPAVRALLEYEPEAMSFSTLPKQILASIVDFCNNLSILRNFKIFGVQIAFALVLVVYSFVRSLMGDLPDYKGLALDLLDETGVISTIGSFILSYIFGKLAAFVGGIVYSLLPGAVQSRLHAVSSSCLARVDVIKEHRQKWSEQFDSIYRKTLAPWERGMRRVQEWDLDS